MRIAMEFHQKNTITTVAFVDGRFGVTSHTKAPQNKTVITTLNYLTT